jgi:hypothetical protein
VLSRCRWRFKKEERGLTTFKGKLATEEEKGQIPNKKFLRRAENSHEDLDGKPAEEEGQEGKEIEEAIIKEFYIHNINLEIQFETYPLTVLLEIKETRAHRGPFGRSKDLPINDDLTITLNVDNDDITESIHNQGRGDVIEEILDIENKQHRDFYIPQVDGQDDSILDNVKMGKVKKRSNKNKTVKELNAEFELLAERVKKLEEKDTSEESGKVQEKLNGIEKILKSYDKKIGDLNRELLQARKDNNIEKGEASKIIDCKVCNKTLKDKPDLKKHIKLMHPKTHWCESCDKTFTDSWKIEEHSELHGNERPFKCSICEKGFYMNWRMEKHIRDPTTK